MNAISSIDSEFYKSLNREFVLNVERLCIAYPDKSAPTLLWEAHRSVGDTQEAI